MESLSLKLYDGNTYYKLSAIVRDMFHQNPKQNPQNKHDFWRQNNNNINPSNNSNIQVHSDIKSEINGMKTASEDALARTFNFFKSELQEK